MSNSKLIIANWKSNMDLKKIAEWFTVVQKKYQKEKYNFKNLKIIICPVYLHISIVRDLIQTSGLPFNIGVQNISPFGLGPYTGEIAAIQVKGMADYVIVGHSERRKLFTEKDGMLKEKVKNALTAGLKVIYCIPDRKTAVPPGVSVIAYEPVWAIGSGQADTPQNADRIALELKKKCSLVLYGGSISPDNIASFIKSSNLDGVLIGNASLDPQKFWEIIVNASSS